MEGGGHLRGSFFPTGGGGHIGGSDRPHCGVGFKLEYLGEFEFIFKTAFKA
jgi:hypothetical protein